MSESGVVLGEGGGVVRRLRRGLGGGWGGGGDGLVRCEQGGVLVGVWDVGGDECGSMYGREA